MLNKYLICFGSFFIITSCGNSLPDDGMAKAAFSTVIEKSDSGCVELSSFKINEKGAKSAMGTDYYEFQYEASIKSLSTCTKRDMPLAHQAVSGFYGVQRKPNEYFGATQKTLESGEEIKAKGRIIFTKTVEGWKAQ